METDGADTVPNLGARRSLTNLDLDTRYDLVSVLGRGGMGEVRLARDCWIGREVAIKVMLTNARDEAAVTRFFREAQVQGLLDHPSVVPIHELGVDAGGNPFFVMKRVSGTTLAEIIDGKRRWTRVQLLTRFVDVCFAIDYAHSRGVIHRDLKPGNIMFGEFGETYVLDWGIAHIVESRHSALSLDAPISAGTDAGHVLGTPGYMSPEQATGATVETPTDVYALGCVLFEILVGKPAIARGDRALIETVDAPYHKPSDHAADIAPELDELCRRATTASPHHRPTARELAQGIQAHLDGDRDVARRRDLAASHARAASLAEGSDDGRTTAMREANRALALDPSNAHAQRILGRLMLAPTRTIPAQAIASADEERAQTRRRVLRMAAYGYFGMIAVIVILMPLPVHARWLLGATAVLALATGLCALTMSRWLMPMRSRWMVALLVLNCMLIGMSGVLFTPLLIMPMFLIGSLTGWLQQPTSYRPWIVIVAHLAPFAVVLVFEWLGVLPSTFRIEAGHMVVAPWAVDLTPWVTAVIFAVTFIAQVVAATVVILQNRFSQEIAQNRLHAHAWHLRQLLPSADDAVQRP